MKDPRVISFGDDPNRINSKILEVLGIPLEMIEHTTSATVWITVNEWPEIHLHTATTDIATEYKFVATEYEREEVDLESSTD